MATTTLARISNAQIEKKQPLSQSIRALVSKVLTGRKLDEFVTSVVNLVNHNKDLAKCDPTSLVASALQSQSLNLSLNQSLGQAWVVPFNDRKNKRTVATFQIGYKGYIQLAIRSGQYRKLNVISIKEGELKFFDPLNEELDVDLIQDEETRANTPTIGYYAMFEYLNGFRKALYWSREKMEAHVQKYSPAYAYDLRTGASNSFWSKDFDAMAQKTMLRQIIGKWGIMSTELIQALDVDMKMASGLNEFTDVADIMDYETPESAGEAVETVEAEASEAVGEAPEESQEQGEPEEPQEGKPAKTQPKAAKKETTKKEATKETPPKETQPKVKASEPGVFCPKTDADGRQRVVTEDYCYNVCKDRAGCPSWEDF